METRTKSGTAVWSVGAEDMCQCKPQIKNLNKYYYFYTQTFQ
jgi:hypothetical protein